MTRGRPKLSDAERQRRQTIVAAWASEVKTCAGLPSGKIEDVLGYGDGKGRTWRALMAGTRIPIPGKLKSLTITASEKGWLNPLAMTRYREYWDDRPPDDSEINAGPCVDIEAHWRSGTLARALLMLASHARKCGVDRERFYSEAIQELTRMKSLLSKLPDTEIEHRARRVSQATVQDLLDGPEYPRTSLRAYPVNTLDTRGGNDAAQSA